jgi:hypothetical protein
MQAGLIVIVAEIKPSPKDETLSNWAATPAANVPFWNIRVRGLLVPAGGGPGFNSTFEPLLRLALLKLLTAY